MDINQINKFLELKNKFQKDIIMYQQIIKESQEKIKIINDTLRNNCDHEYIIDRENYEPHGRTPLICKKCFIS